MFLKQLCLVCILCLTQWVIAQEDTASCDISCHCIRNLTPAGVMISHVHPKKEWMLSYRYMQMGMGTPIQGENTVSELEIYNTYLAYTPSMQMDMHMVMGMVGITNRLTVMVMLNYISNTMEMKMLGNHTHTMSGMTMSANTGMRMNTNGLGDTKLQALYGIVKNSTSQVVLNMGASVPTGSIQQKGFNDDLFYAGSRLPYMMQLGSGSWYIIPGITYVTQKSKVAFSAQLQGIVRLNKNKVGYRFGNELTANTWLGYNWWKGFGSSVRIEGTWSGKIEGFDNTFYKYNEIAANSNNYGGIRFQGLVGLSYQFEEGFVTNHRLAVEYGLPIYQHIVGKQNKLLKTWMASWSYSF